MNLALEARPAGSQRDFPLWHYVLKLLRLRILLTYNSFRRARLRRKIGLIIVTILVLGFAVFVFVMSWLLLGFLRSPELSRFMASESVMGVSAFLEGVPVLILGGAFIGILLTSFGMLLQALYLAGDMDFLLSAPLPIRAVFVTKMLQAILPNFGLIALFALPVLIGMGVAEGYNLLYYPLVVIVLAMLALSAAGLSSLLVMGVVRIFPARRVAEVLGFIGATVSILCSQTGNLMSSTDLGQNQFTNGQVPLTWMARFNSPWSPLAWAGRGLVDLGQGHWFTALLFLTLTLGLTGGLFAISLRTAEQLYYSGWASMQISTRKKKSTRVVPAAPPRHSPSRPWVEQLFPSAVRAVLVKDFLVLRRDLRNMSQVVTPIIFGVVYAVMLTHTGNDPSAGASDAPTWLQEGLKNLQIYGNVAISLFVSWSLLSRLALMGFSQEGKNYWLLKSAPLKAGELVTAKFLVAYLPSLALGWLFMFIISLLEQISASVLIFGLGVVGLSIAGAAGINLTFGIAGANLEWEDPRRMNAGWRGCLSMVASLAYMLFALGLFFGPPLILSGLGIPLWIGQVIGLTLGGLLSLVCAVLPPRWALGRVAAIGEA